jgi:hypothetical protein
MRFVYVASLIGGILLAVRVMMLGVERPREVSPSGERSFRISPPILVAFTVVFGMSGYLLSRRPGPRPIVVAALAAVLGSIASVLTARVVRQWWRVTPEHDVDDERYILQGHLARVVKAIESGDAGEGEVAFEIGSQHRIVRARSLGDVAVDAGTDVVIERIENDVAYVEPWLEVEKRL